MRIFKLIIVGILAVSMAGCLKDKPPVIDPNATENVIEFANTANLTSPTASKYPLLSINIVMDAPATYTAVVSYSGAFSAPEDITVQLDVADPAIIAAYNTQNKTTYTVLPTNLYTLPAKQVVIPKGGKRASVQINFPDPAALYAKNYVLGLTIKSASSGIISGNFGTMLYLLTGIHRFDGIYTMKFKMGANDRNYDQNATTWYFADIQVVTTAVDKAVVRNMNVASPYPHPAVSNGIPTSITNFAPLLTFDLSNNKITNVANNVAPSSSNTKTAIPNPAVTDNRFDPATKNLYFSFILKETGRADMIINDTLVYKSPR